VPSGHHGAQCQHRAKVKAPCACYSATRTQSQAPSNASQSLKWQLIGMSQGYRGALCGHSLSAIANSWTVRRCNTTDIPPPQSSYYIGLYPVARQLLLISLPAEGRRLSWHVWHGCGATSRDTKQNVRLQLQCHPAMFLDMGQGAVKEQFRF